ncbi:MAG TPA: type VI secretion system tube protein Hcp [Vicinamibacterales bacterium]
MSQTNAVAGYGDMFLSVKGAKSGVIKGEAHDSAHLDEIDVLSWSWGMQAQASLGGGNATGRAIVRELRIVKRVDSASTALLSALRANEMITKAVLTMRKAGKSPLEFLKITIEQGRVTGLTIEAGDTSGSPDIVENLVLSFNKITVEYTPQGKDGQPRGSTMFADQWELS